MQELEGTCTRRHLRILVEMFPLGIKLWRAIKHPKETKPWLVRCRTVLIAKMDAKGNLANRMFKSDV